jgi:hypothetical protein
LLENVSGGSPKPPDEASQQIQVDRQPSAIERRAGISNVLRIEFG